MADQDFEKAFSALAHTELEQKAPVLFPYLVGFQLVKKSDDEKQAVAVFGFKIGDQWYYCPVFWLNGKIKGYDLLYIVAQDMFVPLQENWVNYITGRRPYSLGEPEKRNANELGIMAPDFTLFRRSPLWKGASAEKEKLVGQFEPWCRPDMMYRAPSDEKYAGLSKKADLREVLPRLPARLVGCLLETMKKSASFADAMYAFYEPKEIRELAKSAGQKHKRAVQEAAYGVSGNDTEVRILYGPGQIGPSEGRQFTTEQRQQMMAGEPVVVDQRPTRTLAEVYRDVETTGILTNPTLSGIYDILMQGGGFKRGYVLTKPDPIGDARMPSVATVVFPDDGMVVNTPVKQIFARAKEDGSLWTESYKGMKDPMDIGKGSVGLLVAEDGSSSLPFRVLSVVTGSDGNKTLCVVSDDNIDKDDTPRRNWPDDPKMPDYVDYSYNTWDAHCGTAGSGDGSETVGSSGTLRISPPKEKDKKYDSCEGHHILLTTGRRQATNIRDTLIVGTGNMKFLPIKGQVTKAKLGTSADVDLMIRKAGLRRLIAGYDGGSEFSIEGKRASFNESLRHLIVDRRFSESDAKGLLKQARMDGKISVLVKQADVFNVAPPTLSAYNDQYKAPVTIGQEYLSVRPSAAKPPSLEEAMRPIDPGIQQDAVRAARQGQKEVFDLGVLSGLIRLSDIDGEMSNMAEDVMVGNDRIGRMLFIFYWHNDKVSEIYGMEEMQELEDVLRSTFKSVGDLVLFIKQRSSNILSEEELVIG